MGSRGAPHLSLHKKVVRHTMYHISVHKIADHFWANQKRETGIEPATFSLARRRSTTEPLAHIKYYVFVLTCDSHK